MKEPMPGRDDGLIHYDTVERLDVSTLIPYARNARTLSEHQVAQIAASIREFGFTNPVLVDGEAGIIAGHGRVLAAQLLGLEVVPCVRLAHLSEAQKRAYILADNKLALNAGWDDELLALELGDLRDQGFELGVIGFAPEELEVILGEDEVDEEGKTGDDEVPEVLPVPISAPGDVWILGDHRVMCGDSTSLEAVEALAGGVDQVDICWTDPPYNVNYEGSAGKIANDHMRDGDFHRFLEAAFACAFAVLKHGSAIYVAHADTEGFNFRSAFRSAGFKLSGCLIWVKNSLVLGRSDYQWRHEPILYGWKPGAAHRWYGGRAKTTVLEAKDMPWRLMPDGSVQIDVGSGTLRISGEGLQVEEFVSSTIRAEKPKRSAEHPTMKPVDLVLGMLKNSSRPGDSVLDLFGGSGSTLIACQKSGRRARLMEFDPRFVDVIVRRWQDFTGREGVLESLGSTYAETEAARRGGEPQKAA